MPKPPRDDVPAFPGQEFLAAAGLTGGPAQLPELLEGLRRYYERDKANGWAALLAISLIADKGGQAVALPDDQMSYELLGRIAPRSPVGLEWWIIEALAMASHRHETEGVSIDEALGFARPEGRGVRSPVEKAKREAKDVGLAREFVWQLANFGGKIESAYKDVAQRWGAGAGKETVRKALKKYRDRVKTTLQAVLRNPRPPT